MSVRTSFPHTNQTHVMGYSKWNYFSIDPPGPGQLNGLLHECSFAHSALRTGPCGSLLYFCIQLTIPSNNLHLFGYLLAWPINNNLFIVNESARLTYIYCHETLLNAQTTSFINKREAVFRVHKLCLHSMLIIKDTRQVSSMIHSARPKISPVANIVFFVLFC